MDKISGIIPATARTKSADTSGAQPARPGAPSFGRPMGKNSLGDRITLSKQAEEMKASGMMPALPEAPVYKNPTEAKKVKVVEELNAKFFANPKSLARETSGATADTKAEEVLGQTAAAESLYFVEKELRPPQAEPAPLKEVTDLKKA